jgi:ABC-type phosphate transport system permease subunit
MLMDAFFVVLVAIAVLVMIFIVVMFALGIRSATKGFVQDWKRAWRRKDWDELGLLAFLGVLFPLLFTMMILVIALVVQSVI